MYDIHVQKIKNLTKMNFTIFTLPIQLDGKFVMYFCNVICPACPNGNYIRMENFLKLLNLILKLGHFVLTWIWKLANLNKHV
jgi:hypothetical protein